MYGRLSQEALYPARHNTVSLGLPIGIKIKSEIYIFLKGRKESKKSPFSLIGVDTGPHGRAVAVVVRLDALMISGIGEQRNAMQWKGLQGFARVIDTEIIYHSWCYYS